MKTNKEVISKSTVRREREKVNLRKTILSASRDVLTRDGYEAISLRAIADMIEYSPAAIYLHFKDKDAILQALIDEGFDELALQLRKIQDPGSLESLIQNGMNYIQFAVANLRLYEIMFLARSPEDQEYMRAMAEAPPDCFVFLLEAVRAGQEQGTLTRSLPVPVLAYTIWAQLHGMASIAIARQFFWIPEEQIEILFRESAKAIIVGLKP
jgi:AcrR family transcriptional regulator